MGAIDKVIALAKAEIGYHEKASNSQLDSKTANSGRANYTKYARDLDAVNFYNGAKNGYDWCAVFTDWLLFKLWGKDLAQRMTGQPSTGSIGAGCGYAVQYFKNIGRFYNTPKIGDKIYFRWSGSTGTDHVGIVYNVDSTYVHTIEGNTDDGVVGYQKYKLTSSVIVGYGRPKWDLVPDADKNKPAEPEKEEEMTQEKFNEMLSKALNIDGTGKESSKYAAEATEFAKEKGLFVGDADGDFGWKKPITRQDMAIVAKKLFDLLK